MVTNSKSSARPWQGSLLGIVSGIGVVVLGFILLGLLFARQSINPYVERSPFALLLSAGHFVISLLMVSGIGLSTIITIGIFKGKTWSIILSVFFTGMSLIGAIFAISAIAIILYSLLLYCEIMCLRHPFYSA